MTVDEARKVEEKRNVLVAIRFDEHTRELLNWALVKVADPGDRVVAVHVTRNSDSILKDKSLLDCYLEDYQDLCSKMQVDLSGEVVKGTIVRKVLVKEAKKYAATALIVGINNRNPFRCLTSVAKYCACNLPPSTEVLAIHSGKAVLRKSSNKKLPGRRGDPKPSFYINPPVTDIESEFEESDMSEMRRHSHEFILSKENIKDENVRPDEKSRRLSSVDTLENRTGWHFLRGRKFPNPPMFQMRNLSLVKWVLNLPSRSFRESSLRCSKGSRMSPCKSWNGRERDRFVEKKEKNGVHELPRNLQILFRENLSGFNLFSHDLLQSSTSQFSTENLIAKGASNRVYKGILPDGKKIAVKISKSTKEAWDCFTREVDILTSATHKNITPLLGICVDANHLISVYDLMSRGNLEQNLHGTNKEKSVLSWDARFNVAIGIAEALNYLHNECSQPIIHRDIKSSNILLSDEHQPHLADFGLAIWGPTTASFVTESDVVGTFGYLAPEYFMYGKVSDKMDVYSFGVVLLELLSGKRSIGFQTPKGQESLVLWAKPKIENGDLMSLVDPNLDGSFDKDQLNRMARAATLCLTRAARLRPKMNQIMKILRGEKTTEEGTDDSRTNEDDDEDEDDDEVYPDSCAKSHLGLALLDIDDESSTSFSSWDQNSNISFEEFMKGRWSRSSSSG